MEHNRYRASLRYGVRPQDRPLIHHNHRVSRSSPVCVHVDFVCETIKRHLIRRCDRYGNPQDLRLVRQQRLTVESYQCLDPSMYESHQTIQGIAASELSSLQVEEDFHLHISYEVAVWVRRVLGWQSNVGRKVIPLRVTIRVVRTYICDERDLIFRRALIRAMEESNENYGMVPASKSSVKGLKRKRLTESDQSEKDCKESKTTCTICYEDLPKGTEVTCMPCSHVFHTDCITTWLEKSHSCPICRFELPTTDSDTKLEPELRALQVGFQV